MSRKHSNTAELTGEISFVESLKTTKNGIKVQQFKIKAPVTGKSGTQTVIVTAYGPHAEAAAKFKAGDRVSLTGEASDGGWNSAGGQKNNRVEVSVSHNRDGHAVAGTVGDDRHKITLCGVVKYVHGELETITWDKDGEKKEAKKLYFVTGCQAYAPDGAPYMKDGKPVRPGVACEVIGKTAEEMFGKLKEGAEVDVTGQIRNRGWKDGDTGRAKGHLNVDSVTIVNAENAAEESKAA